MKRLLAVVVVVISAVPLSAAFGPERPVTNAALGPVTARQLDPSVTSGTEQFLVIWTDFRSGSPDAFATRVDLRGAGLDPTGIVLGRNMHASSVASPGRRYIVAMTEECSAVRVVTVDGETGAVGIPRQIGNLGGVCGTVKLVANGETVLAIMGNGGALLDPEGLPVFEAFDLPQNPIAGASNGRDYIVLAQPKAGTTQRDVVVAGVSRRGGVTTTQTLESGGEVSGGDVAASGISYLVVWTTTTEVKAAVIADDFGTAGPTRVLVSGTNFSAPRLVWTGSEYRLAFIDGGAGGILKIMSLDTDGSIKEGPVEASGPGQEHPPAFGSLPHAKAIAVWHSPGEGIIAGFFEAGRSVALGPYSTTTNLTSAATAQERAASASLGTQAVVVWKEGRSLVARRTDGSTTGSDVTHVATIGDPSWAHDVEFDGSVVWITWRDGRVLFTRRYTPDLAPRDNVPIRVAERVEHFDSAAGVNQVLFVWTGEPIIATAVLSPSDPAALATTVVSREQYTAGEVAAAWNGSAFQVAWVRLVQPVAQGLSENIEELRVARVGANAGVLDSEPHLLSPSRQREVGPLRLASNGQGTAAVWARRTEGGIRNRMIDSNGVPTGDETELLAHDPATQIESVTVFRNQYLVGTSTAVLPLHVRYDVKPIGGPRETIAEVDVVSAERALALSGLTNRIVAFYVHRADGPQFGSVNRLFMKVSEGITVLPRRRAVRH